MINDDKSLAVQAFVNVFKTDLDIFKGNRIAVLTSFGLIIGDLIDDSTENPTTLQSIFISMDKSFKKSFDEEKPDSEIGIFLTLENAEIITSGNKLNLPIISIFYDQIIGISLSE